MIASKALIVASLATLCVVAPAQQVTLRFKPPVGKTFKYTMVTKTSQSGGPMSVGDSSQMMTMTMKILSQSAGKTVMESAITDAKVNMSANPQMKGMATQVENMLKNFKATTTLDPYGKGLDTKVAGGNPMMQGIASNIGGGVGSMYSFPKEAVGVGSTWKVPFDFGKVMAGAVPGMKLSGGKTNVVCKLTGFENSGGKRIAVISTTVSATIGMSLGAGGTATTTTNSKGVLKVDVATGMPVSVNSENTSKTSMGTMIMNQTTSTSMKLAG